MIDAAVSPSSPRGSRTLSRGSPPAAHLPQISRIGPSGTPHRRREHASLCRGTIGLRSGSRSEAARCGQAVATCVGGCLQRQESARLSLAPGDRPQGSTLVNNALWRGTATASESGRSGSNLGTTYSGRPLPSPHGTKPSLASSITNGFRQERIRVTRARRTRASFQHRCDVQLVTKTVLCHEWLGSL